MRKEIELSGCVEIPQNMTMDDFADEFLLWIESKGWRFGGGFREIIDGHYVLPNGKKGKAVAEDE